MKNFDKLILGVAIFLSANAIGQDAPPAVNPVQLGRSSNIYTSLLPQQNQVYADDATDRVIFIHQHDITIWGGGTTENGKIRYDISTDGGATFSNDIGILNPSYDKVSRFPQIIGVADSLLWTASTLNSSDEWDGYVIGLVSEETSGNPSVASEHYVQAGTNTYQPGGLSEGWTDGGLRDVWMTDVQHTSAGFGNEVRLLHAYADDDSLAAASWNVVHTFNMPHDLTLDGDARVVSPNLAFSPDKMHGWVAMLGDLTGGPQHTRNPIFIHSSDHGYNWDAPVEVDLSTAYYGSGGTLYDELRDLWVDMNNAPLSTGVPTCGYEFDLTVDADGNPHMLAVVGSASTTSEPTSDYGFEDELAKLIVDVSSSDLGATWNISKVSPIYTFKGESGFGANLLEHYNYPQISRTADGSHMFYSWVDSDTTEANGGIGFGEAENLYPNLRIAGRRMADNRMTCPKWITNGDLLWDGRAILPTMAPEVLTADGGATFKLPIVMADMLNGNPDEPCRYYYYGNDAVLTNAEFTSDCFTTVSVADNVVAQKLIEVYPNPTESLVKWNGITAQTVEVMDNTGRVVLNVAQPNGTVDISSLTKGVYILRLENEEGIYTSRVLKQ